MVNKPPSECPGCEFEGGVVEEPSNRGEFYCEWCGAFLTEDGKLPVAEEKRCPDCKGAVKYGILTDPRKGIRGYRCDECDKALSSSSVEDASPA